MFRHTLDNSQNSSLNLNALSNIDSSSEKDHGSNQSHDQSYSTSTKKIQFYSNAQLMSPLEKDIVEFKDFSTPIQIAEFSQNKKCQGDEANDNSTSPLIKIELKNVRNITEGQNEEESESMESFEESHEIQVDTVLDLMGNRIYEFNLGTHYHSSPENDQQLSPIAEDKQNDFPQKYMNLNTPLKIRHNDIRSPLQDITPSMTHKKREDPFHTKTNKKNKTSNKTANKGLGLELEKWGLQTPRTMAESRLNSNRVRGEGKVVGGNNNEKLKIARFL